MTLFTRLTQSANNSTLKIIPDYDVQLGADARVTHWWDFHQQRVTLNSNNHVTRITSRKPSGVDLVQSVDAKAPNYDAANSAYGGKPILYFDQLASVDVMTLESNNFPATGSWSMVAILESANVSSTEFLGGGSSTANGQHTIVSSISAGTQYYSVRVGTGANAQLSVGVPQLKDIPVLYMATWNLATNTVGMSINGGPWVTIANASINAVSSDLGFQIGAGSAGTVKSRWATALVANVCLRTESSDLLEVVKNYARTFGLTIL